MRIEMQVIITIMHNFLFEIHKYSLQKLASSIPYSAEYEIMKHSFVQCKDSATISTLLRNELYRYCLSISTYSTMHYRTRVERISLLEM